LAISLRAELRAWCSSEVPGGPQPPRASPPRSIASCAARSVAAFRLQVNPCDAVFSGSRCTVDLAGNGPPSTRASRHAPLWLFGSLLSAELFSLLQVELRVRKSRLTPEPSCQPCCFRLVFRRPASRRETSSHSAIVVGRRPRQASCRRGGHHTSMYVCAEALPCVFHRGLHTRARARVSGGARVRNVEGGTRGGKRSSDHGSTTRVRSKEVFLPRVSLHTLLSRTTMVSSLS